MIAENKSEIIPVITDGPQSLFEKECTWEQKRLQQFSKRRISRVQNSNCRNVNWLQLCPKQHFGQKLEILSFSGFPPTGHQKYLSFFPPLINFILLYSLFWGKTFESWSTKSKSTFCLISKGYLENTSGFSYEYSLIVKRKNIQIFSWGFINQNMSNRTRRRVIKGVQYCWCWVKMLIGRSKVNTLLFTTYWV